MSSKPPIPLDQFQADSPYDTLALDFETRFKKKLTTTAADNPEHRRIHPGQDARDFRSRDMTPEERKYAVSRATELGLDARDYTEPQKWKNAKWGGPHLHMNTGKGGTAENGKPPIPVDQFKADDSASTLTETPKPAASAKKPPIPIAQFKPDDSVTASSGKTLQPPAIAPGFPLGIGSAPKPGEYPSEPGPSVLGQPEGTAPHPLQETYNQLSRDMGVFGEKSPPPPPGVLRRVDELMKPVADLGKQVKTQLAKTPIAPAHVTGDTIKTGRADLQQRQKTLSTSLSNLNARKKSFDAAADEIEKQRKDLEQQHQDLDGLLREVQAGNIPEEDYRSLQDDYNKAVDRFNENIGHHQAEVENFQKSVDEYNSQAQSLQKDSDRFDKQLRGASAGRKKQLDSVVKDINDFEQTKLRAQGYGISDKELGKAYPTLEPAEARKRLQQDALAEANQKAKAIGQKHKGLVEVGEQNGWAYVKPKGWDFSKAKPTPEQITKRQQDFHESEAADLEKDIQGLLAARSRRMQTNNPPTPEMDAAIFEKLRAREAARAEIKRIKEGGKPQDLQEELRKAESRRADLLHQAVKAQPSFADQVVFAGGLGFLNDEDYDRKRLYAAANAENDRAQYIKKIMGMEQLGVSVPAIVKQIATTATLQPDKTPWWAKGFSANVAYSAIAPIQAANDIINGIDRGLGISDEGQAERVEAGQRGMQDIAERGGAGFGPDVTRMVGGTVAKLPMILATGDLGGILGATGEAGAFGLLGATEAAGQPGAPDPQKIVKAFIENAAYVPIYKAAGLIPSQPVRIAAAGAVGAALPAIMGENGDEIVTSSIVSALLAAPGGHRDLFSLNPDRPPSYLKPFLSDAADFIAQKYGMSSEEAADHISRLWKQAVDHVSQTDVDWLKLRRDMRDFVNRRNAAVDEVNQAASTNPGPAAERSIRGLLGPGPEEAGGVAPRGPEPPTPPKGGGAPKGELPAAPGRSAVWRTPTGEVPITVTQEIGNRVRVEGVKQLIPKSDIEYLAKGEGDARKGQEIQREGGPPGEARRGVGEGGREVAGRSEADRLRDRGESGRREAQAPQVGDTVVHPKFAQGRPLTVKEEARPGEEPPEKHEYASTQVNLPDSPITRKVRALGLAIPQRDLAEDGREEKPHITVKYGLHGEEPEKVKALLADVGPITVKLGKTSVFPASKENNYDVVKIDVDSADLHALNKKIADALPHTDTFPGYEPHLTIAYVKPGMGKKYAGKSTLTGQTITLNSLAFSDKAGNITEIPLTGTKQGAVVAESEAEPQLSKGEKAYLDQANRRRTAERQAETHPKTGLPNSRALERALPSHESNKKNRVISLDGNNFGKANKGPRGMAAGDEMMIEMANSMSAAAKEVSPHVRVFHIGGDEFAVLAPDQASAEKFLKGAEEKFGTRYVPFEGKQVPISLSGSIGSTFKEADESLKAAKDKRKSEQAAAKTAPQEVAAPATTAAKPPTVRSEAARRVAERKAARQKPKTNAGKLLEGESEIAKSLRALREEARKAFEEGAFERLDIPKLDISMLKPEHQTAKTKPLAGGEYTALNFAGIHALSRIRGRSVGGVTYNTTNAREDAEIARDMAADETGAARDNLLLIADTLERLAGEHEEFAIGRIEDLRHEATHVAQLAIERFFGKRLPDSVFEAMPHYEAVRAGLQARGYAWLRRGSGRVFAFEGMAHIAGGQDIGLSPVQEAQFADAYFTATARVFGADSLKRFRQLEGKLQELRDATIERERAWQQAAATARGRQRVEAIPAMAEGREGRVAASLLERQRAKEALELRAYHGSPHRFEKFSTEKIGTGEGAQAYGYGLYFTDKRDIAEYYRGQLVGGYGKPKWIYDGKPVSSETTGYALTSALDFVNKQSTETVAEALKREISGLKLHVGFAKKTYGDVTAGIYERAIETLEKIDPAKLTVPGATYTVKLAPKDDEYLLWDRPYSQQSEKVKSALEATGEAPFRPDATGEELYGQIARSVLPDEEWTKEDNERWKAGRVMPRRGESSASAFLHSLGIRGNKYLAGDSRSAGEGNYNYVIFSDEDVSIEAMENLAPEEIPLPPKVTQALTKMTRIFFEQGLTDVDELLDGFEEILGPEMFDALADWIPEIIGAEEERFQSQQAKAEQEDLQVQEQHEAEIRQEDTQAEADRRQRLPASRPPSRPTLEGEATTITVPGSSKEFPARYQARELEDVYPSHNPQNFQPNPNYEHVNDRRYDREKAYQQDVIANSQPGVFKPQRVVNNSDTAENGPPIIDPNGNVLGGNSRAMIIARVYDAGNGGPYKAEILRQAGIYGLDIHRLAGMKRPVLVREMTDATLEAQDAVTALNVSGTRSLTPAERSIAEAQGMPEATVEFITTKIENAGEDVTLSQVLDKSGVDIINRLIDDGVFQPQERNALIKGGDLLPEAKKRIERMLMGRLFRDLDQLDRTPAAVLRNLERSVAPIIRVSGLSKTSPPEKTASVEGAADRRTADAKFFSDILKTPAVQKEGLSALDIPTQRAVMARVIRAIHEPKIRKAIVELVPVDVMNHLASLQPSAKVGFHNQAVNADFLTVDVRGAVSVRGDIGLSLVDSVASALTEDFKAPGGARGFGEELNAAVATGTVERGHGAEPPSTSTVSGASARTGAPPTIQQTASDWDILPEVRYAIDLATEARAAGSSSLDEFARQPSMFRPRDYTPREVALAKTIQLGPVKTSAAFKKYAAEAELAKTGGGLFGAMTPEEAFAQFFGLKQPIARPEPESEIAPVEIREDPTSETAVKAPTTRTRTRSGGGGGGGRRTKSIVLRGEPSSSEPSGEGVAPAVQRELIRARPDSAPAVNTAIVPQSIAKSLRPHQVETVAMGIKALDSQGGFIVASGTGAGKTRAELGIAEYYRKEAGRGVLIVSPSEVIKPNWDKGTMKGSFAKDAKAMGVDISLLKEGKVEDGTIRITTYNRLGQVSINPGETVVIFDEAHSLKNADSARSQKGTYLANRAHSAVFASATPADKVSQLDYLARAGIFEGKAGNQAYRDLGLMLTTIKVGKRPYQKEIQKWVVNPKVGAEEVTRRLDALFARMSDKGLQIKHEISMEGVPIVFHRIEMPQEAHDAMADIESFYGGLEEASGLQKARILMHQRRQQEPYKLDTVVDMVKDARENGRQAVVFLSRVNESEVGQDIYEKGEIIGRDVLMSSEGTAKSLKTRLQAEGITDIAELHGGAKMKGADAMDDFQSGKSGVIIATIESGGTGINLDDVKGDAPRTLIVMTAPFSAVENVQAAGRVWRLTTASVPELHYLFGDTDVDAWNRAIIAEKMRTLHGVVEGESHKLGPRERAPDAPQSFESLASPEDLRGFSDLEEIAAKPAAERIKAIEALERRQVAEGRKVSKSCLERAGRYSILD